VVGNGRNDSAQKPKPAVPKTANEASRQFGTTLKSYSSKSLTGDKRITDLKNFQAGEPSTTASGVQLDRRHEREPIEVQLRALKDKKKDLQSRVDVLYDEARKKDVEPGELP